MSVERSGLALEELLRIVAKLRDPNGGCPWDLEQTHKTLRPYVIEEAFEVVDALDQLSDDSASHTKLADELGDLLLQVVLHAQIASESKTFSMVDIIQAITDKLIKRHPHVFGDVKVNNSTEVLNNWERLKQKDLPNKKGVLDGVPRGMPGLLRSHRLGEKAARVGFDWGAVAAVKDKVLEEISEFLDAEEGSPNQADELGDILFSLAQLARKSNLNGEELLALANDRFSTRFRTMEELSDMPLSELSAEELESLWQRAKEVTKSSEPE